MRRPAFFPAMLFITLPDHGSILAIGVPNLTSIYPATFSADNLPGKWIHTACKAPVRFPAFQLILYQVKNLRRDNRRMAICHIVLRYFPLVDFLLLRKEVHRKPLL